ncbi:hypothetical protein V7128_05645 [Neobacillus vireti]|uniref:hypothetical protein n=1 Tax=Neobacillus vireti TaxID=220686 RepID=UPI002FFD9463
MKYSFKENDEFSKAVFLNNNGDQIFVCNLYPTKLQEGETPSQCVERQIKEAGYESREDFWNKKVKGLK